jgi:CRISPR-associated protein Cas5t
MKLLHARLEGWTATFRLPLIYSGTGLTAPLPPYSTILGLIGNLAGRQIAPNETRIGYIFRSRGTSYDLETSRRLEMDKDG